MTLTRRKKNTMHIEKYLFDIVCCTKCKKRMKNFAFSFIKFTIKCFPSNLWILLKAMPCRDGMKN